MDLILFLRNFENAIENVEINSFTEETIFKEIEQWDSLAFLTTLAMVDSEYKVELTAEEVYDCVTTLDLFNLILTKFNK